MLYRWSITTFTEADDCKHMMETFNGASERAAQSLVKGLGANNLFEVKSVLFMCGISLHKIFSAYVLQQTAYCELSDQLG